jgi:hypothetical protein
MGKCEIYFWKRQKFFLSPSPKRKMEIANFPEIKAIIGLEIKFAPVDKWQERSSILR